MAYGPFDLGGLTVRELATRVWAEASDDNVWDAAAQLGYYFLLALFPLLIFLLSFAALVPTENQTLASSVMGTLRDVMPGQAYALMEKEVGRILNSSSGGLLTFGMLGTIWAASSGVVSLIGTLNRAYEAKETRGFIGLRLRAVGLTFALAILMILGAVMIVTGDQIVGWAAAALQLGGFTKVIGAIVNYALGLGMLFAALELVYYAGPNVKDQSWHWVSPGSIAGVMLFVISSFAFTIYLRFNDTYSVTYGSIGAVIVLMLWLYLLGLSIVIGAEINSEIARAADARGRADAPDDNVDSAEAKAKAATDTAARTPGAADSKAEEKREEPKPEPKAGPKPAPSTATEPPREAAVPPSEGESAHDLRVRDLLLALEHQNSQVRAGAAAAFRNFERVPDSVLEALSSRLEDENDEVRAEAARTLERFANKVA